MVDLPAWVVDKILRGHPEMDGHIEDILEAVARPDVHEPDPYVAAQRERFFKANAGPRTWLRVVVEWERDTSMEGRVVTAFPQDRDPR